MIRTKPCGRTGCRGLALPNCVYCSRSCAMTVLRANQTPEHRRRIALHARERQGANELRLMVERVKTLADTEDQRLALAWRLGKMAAKSERFRFRLKSRLKVA